MKRPVDLDELTALRAHLFGAGRADDAALVRDACDELRELRRAVAAVAAGTYVGQSSDGDWYCDSEEWASREVSRVLARMRGVSRETCGGILLAAADALQAAGLLGEKDDE